MIEFQDQIELPPSQLEAVRELFKTRYLPAASARGMTLLETRVSPPLKLATGSITLWQRWQVADVPSWWAMRAQSGTPDVAQFWQEIDDYCLSRERIYFSDDHPEALPKPQSTSPFESPTRGHRETAQLLLKNALSDKERTRFIDTVSQAKNLPALEAFSLEANLAPDYAAGDFTLDLLFPNANAAKDAKSSELWRDTLDAITTRCQACHALSLETIGAGAREPAIKNSIKRTAYFRLLPGTDIATAQRFENDLLEMPAQIPQILNWRLSRAVESDWNKADVAPWTYVWEQEFAQLDDLLGPYMTHPHHWAHIDRWFDPESGVQAVDTNLSHAFSPLSDSLIGREITNT